MIPADIRLYTWVDVEDVLLRSHQKNDWPEGLIEARSYWDGLHLSIEPGTREKIIEWLAGQFDPWFDQENRAILLESARDKERILPVFLEETADIPPNPRTIPTFSRPTVVSKSYEPKYPNPLPDGYPPVIAFHSFKGGVGRTLYALATAQALIQKRAGEPKILLIDGDLEAPGLTWLLYSRITKPAVSFVDLLALVHGEPDPGAGESIALAAERLKDMSIDGIYVLPSFRAISHFTSLEIRPEHLIKNSEDPFILTKILSGLGKEIGADAVIIDLRAGFSELSTGLLLDPRVYKVIVTTLSSQSIEGTCQLLEQLIKTLGRWKNPKKGIESTDPFIIINQVPENEWKGELVYKTEEKIITAVGNSQKEADGEEIGGFGNIIDTPFNPNLLALSGQWDEVMRDIRKAGLTEQLNPLIDWLPGELTRITTSGEISDFSELKTQRKRLEEFSQKLIYAEKKEMKDFLAISSLKSLASDFRGKVPVAVVIGAKGAGKTYTYLQLVFREKWQAFVKDAMGSNDSIDAFICPVLHSMNVDPNIKNKIEDTLEKTTKELKLTKKASDLDIKDYVKNNLRRKRHEGEWREHWLDILAWQCGFKNGQKGVGKEFNVYLKDRKQYVVAIIDGLEDLFQDLPKNESQQTALRSLLQDVPLFLEQQPYKQIGLIVFVRQDMVNHAIKQNIGQLTELYQPYALKWNETEALRLAAWIAVEACVLLIEDKKRLEKMEWDDLVVFLKKLWGQKLGKDDSNEANSAVWVLSALSDLKGQIQARDIVRLLNISARGSIDDSYWTDRIIVPLAIKKSIDECSRQKITEIGEENPPLKLIFDKLERLQDKKIPITVNEVGLDTNEIQVLENNGVIFKEKDKYYIPEIFRRGLGFNLGGARPRVLALLRRARR